LGNGQKTPAPEDRNGITYWESTVWSRRVDPPLNERLRKPARKNRVKTGTLRIERKINANIHQKLNCVITNKKKRWFDAS